MKDNKNEINCIDCAWRKKYDENSKSILGRLWRFHIRFCPGWSQYMKTLTPEERGPIKEQYKIITNRY